MDRYRVALLVAFAVVVTAIVIVVSHVGGSPAENPTSSSAAHITPGAPDPDLIQESQRPAAPEFTGLTGWLNSPPLTLAGLRGRVVLIDFWTYSCVNCVDTFPYLRTFYNDYTPQGLTVVGVHSPEFDFEKSPTNVAAAVKRDNVTWPVALDPNMATWNAWSNQYWPAEYLVDQQGRVAYYTAGEGDYDKTERALASLLGADTAAPLAAPPATDAAQTPELYAGSSRGHLDGQEQYGPPDVSTQYPDPGPPAGAGSIQIVGGWADHQEYLESTTAGHVRLRFHASDLFIVAETASPQPISVGVIVDGAAVTQAHAGADLSPSGTLTVSRSDLYQLLTGYGSSDHLIDLSVPAGFRLYTFTFE